MGLYEVYLNETDFKIFIIKNNNVSSICRFLDQDYTICPSNSQFIGQSWSLDDNGEEEAAVSLSLMNFVGNHDKTAEDNALAWR